MSKVRLKRSQMITIVKFPIILLVLFFVLFPFFYLVVTSIRPAGEFLENTNILPRSFTLDHYREVFDGQKGLLYLKNSLVVTGTVVLISIVVGTMAGYALVRSRFRQSIVLTIIFILIFIRFYPRISIVVPWFLIMNRLHLLDTVWAVIILHLGLTIPFVVWLMYTFFKGVPMELEECASIDGAGFMRRFISIVLPLSLPGIASASIFTAFLSWNEFLLSSAVTRESAKTLPVVIAGYITDKGVVWGPMMAMSTLIVLPMILFALFLQKYLIRGMMMGAVKE